MSEGVLLVLDSAGTPFERIWCCFEEAIAAALESLAGARKLHEMCLYINMRHHEDGFYLLRILNSCRSHDSSLEQLHGRSIILLVKRCVSQGINMLRFNSTCPICLFQFWSELQPKHMNWWKEAAAPGQVRKGRQCLSRQWIEADTDVSKSSIFSLKRPRRSNIERATGPGDVCCLMWEPLTRMTKLLDTEVVALCGHFLRGSHKRLRPSPWP